jgi:hypothetical protein
MAEVSSLEKGTVVLGNGAQFWAYISPENDTAKAVTKWTVTFKQQRHFPAPPWEGSITSDNPHQILQTPGMSGVFQVTVWASGPSITWQKLEPVSWSNPDIGCNSNCAAMVGIVATPDGTGANYWTTWDAICKR